MVPYIHLPDLHIGPIPLHPFGILVATGVLVGTGVTTRRARTLGYDVNKLNSFVTWMLVTAFVLSHILDSLFYHWDEVVQSPLSILELWKGLSSFGGFLGAVVGIVLWKYFVIEDGRPRVRVRPVPLLPFADLVLSVLPLGWALGRAGCASVHDHPGAPASADTLLAVAYPACPSQEHTTSFGCIEAVYQRLSILHPRVRCPDNETVTRLGIVDFIHGHDPRFDLGFLELLFTVILTICFALTWRRRLPMGTYVIATALAYSPVRFAMDFLRIPQSDPGGDTRYANMTPAQWGCIALFLYGVWMMVYARSLRAKGGDPAEALRAPSPESGTEAKGIA